MKRWFARPFTAAIDALGLPRWSTLAFAAVPIAAAGAGLVRTDSSLPLPVEIGLMLVTLAPFMFDALANRRADMFVRLVPILGVLPLLATGSDRVILWIPAFALIRNFAFGDLTVRLLSVAGSALVLLVAAVTAPELEAAGLAAVGYFAAVVTGLAGAHTVRIVTQLQETEQLLAIEAARAERRRFAREVHDVIAHSMTVTLLHLQAARLTCRTAPEDAEAALLEAERVGRASLDDLRRTVRLLSDESEGLPDFPSELFDSVKLLVEGFTTAGADVNLVMSNGIVDVPPVIAQGVYRIVQESLTNAVRHAPGSHIEVEIDVGSARINFRVENGLASPAGSRPSSRTRERPRGQGLRGMIERASLLDGHLETGPTKAGWRVAGWLPVEPPPGGIEP